MNTGQFRLILVCVLAPLAAPAARPVELFGGYAVGMVKPNKDTDRMRLNGWNASITSYPFSGGASRVGFTADFAGFSESVHPATVVGARAVATGSTVDPVSARQYSFLVGPQFRLLRKGRFETSFKALVGGAYAHALGDSGPSDPTLAALFGSNIDYSIHRRVAFRVSPGMYLTRFGPGETQRDFRFSTGLVFRLGGGE